MRSELHLFPSYKSKSSATQHTVVAQAHFSKSGCVYIFRSHSLHNPALKKLNSVALVRKRTKSRTFKLIQNEKID
jgi:hypothetical protein